MASIFSRIVSGEIPCYKVAENETCMAFLDINPIAKGHTLVIPKKETDYIFDLDNGTYTALMDFSKQVAKAVQSVIPCERIGIAVIGLEVPHAHVHLVPIDQIDDLNFNRPKLKFADSEFQKIADNIGSNF